ncbi:MAG: hypothetical protein ACXWOL_14805 [Ktedonobacteraceae bacterium]
MAFNPNEHMRQLKNKEGLQDYLDVKWRLVWFREQCPLGTIDTEELEYDTEREVQAEVWQWNNDTRRSEKVIKHARGYARYRAVVTDGKGARATGTKDENAANFAEYGPKAETGAVGRALAMLGYGTQFTGDELDEQHRIVDAPVDRSTPASDSNGNERKPIVSVRTATVASNGKAKGTSAEDNAADTLATDQQLASIRKLCQHLGKTEPEHPDTLRYQDAKALITQLSHEYNEQKQHRKAS